MLGRSLSRLRYRDKGWELKPPALRSSSRSRTASDGKSKGYIDFSYVSPISSIPRQSDAARIPHMDIKHITRTVVPRSEGGKVHPRYPQGGGVAADHHKYVTDGALGYAKHYDYITRQGGGRGPGDFMPVVDMLDFEAAHREENALAVCSNIGATAERQRSLFEAAERCEREAKGGTLTTSTEHAAAWVTAAREPDAPAWVMEASRLLQTALAEVEVTAAKKRELKLHKVVELCAVTLAEAYERLIWADRAIGRRSPAVPNFKQGPCGRVQTRFVVELPRSLKPWQQREILEGFCARLGKDGWMFVGAIHRPDPHNTLANMHMHVDAYDRPSEWLHEHGCWDFEYRTKKRNGKWTYPYRQNKIEVLRGEKGEKSGYDVASAYFKGLRADYVELANKVAAGTPGNPHYVAGTYAENGISKTPLKHLGNKVIANEKRGLVTVTGSRNARAMFGDLLHQIRLDLLRARIALRAQTKDRLARAKTSAAQRAIGEWQRLSTLSLFRQAQARLTDVVGTMVASRAQAVIDHPHQNDAHTLAKARERIADVDSVSPQAADRAAELATLAALDTAAFAQLEEAQKFDRNALPPLLYRTLSTTPVTSHPSYRNKERGRLLRWLDEHGGDRAALLIDDDGVKLGPKVSTPSTDRLLRLHIGEISVQEWLHRERLRRGLEDAISAADPESNVGSVVVVERSFDGVAQARESTGNVARVKPAKGGLRGQAEMLDALDLPHTVAKSAPLSLAKGPPKKTDDATIGHPRTSGRDGR